jgi:hypothetical protein
VCKNAIVRDREFCSVKTQKKVRCRVMRSDKNYLQAKVASPPSAANAQMGQGPPISLKGRTPVRNAIDNKDPH